MDNEIWKPVPGYEGYYSISSLGRVRSEERIITRADGFEALVRGRILSPTPTTSGYLIVVLHRDGKGRNRSVHQLVAESFIGPAAPGLHVRHKDGTRVNNRLDNLEYGTHSDNMLDSVRHGTHVNARKDSCPKGHRYVDGNLLAAPLKRGQRVCRACINAKARIKKKGWDPSEADRLADSYYEKYTRDGMNQPGLKLSLVP